MVIVTEDLLDLSNTRRNTFECFHHKEMINDDLDMVTHTYNPRTQEVEARRLQVGSQPRLRSKPLSQNSTNQKHK